MKFSQRIGKTPSTKDIQLESLDDDLKNSLWNALKLFVFDQVKHGSQYSSQTEYDMLIILIWVYYFKRPIDTIPKYDSRSEEILRKHFFEGEWYETYDFLEFIANIENRDITFNKRNLIQFCNKTLEKEFSGYRFIDDKIAPISNEVELSTIKNAIFTTGSLSALKGANLHLQKALDKLSDRKNPDYRNSIKESISAVESIAKVISGNKKGTLGSALTNIKKTVGLHNALEKGFKQIYGYTSDEGGIRHALMGVPNCDFEDAKYMLVSCSGFINYLIQKANKIGIKIE